LANICVPTSEARPVGRQAVEQCFARASPARGVAVDAHDGHVRETLGERVFQSFGAFAERIQREAAALRARAWHGLAHVAVMAAQRTRSRRCNVTARSQSGQRALQPQSWQSSTGA
jgi:hypothetical protein